MIDPPQIKETIAQHYAYIHLTVARESIQNVMGPGVQEVYEALAAQGVTSEGPWFTHHLKRPDAFFDFEICVPTAVPVRHSGRVAPGVWPAIRVAQTVYHGDYSGLPAAWGEFEAWIAAQGLKGAKDLWERYLVNPNSSRNPADWRTELNRPLLEA
jgi:effector-binding domain-containing protein